MAGRVAGWPGGWLAGWVAGRPVWNCDYIANSAQLKLELGLSLAITVMGNGKKLIFRELEKIALYMF